MKEIFDSLNTVKQVLKTGRVVDLDTSDPYYIKGLSSNNDKDIRLFKNSKDGSTYNLRFDIENNTISWWHNQKNEKENLNLSEGQIKRLSDGSYGFYTFDSMKENEEQRRQGIIENPNLGNVKYLIEETDLELAKLLKVAYPKEEIISENSNIQYYKEQEEVIEQAYEENKQYDEENDLVSQLQKIQEEIKKLELKKKELEHKLEIKNRGENSKERG